MNKSSGKSKSIGNPQGVRRIVGGEALAPRSVRRKGKKRFFKNCTKRQLEKAQMFVEEKVEEEEK